ncbi:radical SAM protein [Nocardia sp. NPDC058518]|uniref:radical SAM protein n=1 Tax=Nocardia sp. NPDC058518 TaxID=3346534 RepID=UPI00364B7FAD
MTARRYLSGAGSVPLDPPTSVVWELATRRDDPARRRPVVPGDHLLGTTACFELIDDLARIGVDAVEIGGGEPTERADFWAIVDRVRERGMSLAFDTDGTGITPAVARRLAGDHRLTARIRLSAATSAADDVVRGAGAYRASVRAMELLASTGDYEFEVTAPLTRHTADHLDALAGVADLFGARLRLTGDRPTDSAPDAGQRRALAAWLRAHGGEIRLGPHLTGDLAETCGAGIDTCRIDATGLVFACPVPRPAPPVGTIRAKGGFAALWQQAPLLAHARTGGCPAAPAVARGA